MNSLKDSYYYGTVPVTNQPDDKAVLKPERVDRIYVSLSRKATMRETLKIKLQKMIVSDEVLFSKDFSLEDGICSYF